MVRIWIDTDVGTNVDDAFCLALAARDPRVELVGVSTVYADVALRARIAEVVLELAGAGDVPVGVGYGSPMTLGVKPEMGGHEGVGVLDAETLDLLRGETPTAPGFDAHASLLSLMSEIEDEDVWMVAIGPLTNLAWMQREHPSAHRASIMGGSTDPAVHEWNWSRDPVAAEVVLDSDRDLRVHPYQVTRRVVLDGADLDALRDGDALARMLADETQRWLAVRPDMGKPPPHKPFMHDPVAIAALIDPGLVDYRPACVELDSDARLEVVDGEPNCDLAVDVDAHGIKDLLLSSLL